MRRRVMPRHRLPVPVFETLAAAARRLAIARDPWWVIGSAAAALHRLDGGTIGDIDILTSTADARRLLSEPDVSAVAEDGGEGPFRSEIFARLAGLPLTVEILGGFRLRGAPLVIETRVAVPMGEAPVFIPSREELIRILRLFGRPKDIARADALAALG